MRGGAHPHRLRHRVGEAVARHGLWAPGDRVAVAVSGGLDSVCLLDLLRETAAWHKGRLEVVTLDHGIHPDSSDHADFVEDLARRLELPCTRVALGLGEVASEARARQARYAVLDGLEVQRVALAHHRDDQAETLLVNLLRGTGLRGLGAMRPRRGRYVRPLLEVPREALQTWATHRGLAWVEDPTNTDPRYLRNRLRAEVLPLLEEIRPGAARALARTAARCAEVEGAPGDGQALHDPLVAPLNVAEQDKLGG